ncbi:MAG: ABC transporter substrate binding protein (PQQ-dependent alcohol dehydrogenase system) [Paracoccaceae bacterium]|jgi:ABC transporter substrate binding protein (PQQ-dependent alcohol dehydrogenase system)
MGATTSIFAALLAWGLGMGAALAADPLRVPVAWLEFREAPRPTLSNLDPIPDDDGRAGARLGLEDNQATGRFMGQDFALTEIIVAPDEDPGPAMARALAASPLVVVKGSAAQLQALADLPGASGALIFNATSQDVTLRMEGCRRNLLHTAPSRAMLADALAQFLMKKRWSDWMLIAGVHPGDQAYADAIRRAANKFGARIRSDKVWAFDADMRRSAGAETPLFTQGPDVDVIVVADELDDWARYILYNTWEPRPVVGTEGLSPRAWSPSVEAWGAAQLQGRFEALAGRHMTSADYGAWAALRTIGEAATRTRSADAKALRAYILSPEFELGGFKGRKMTYRAWNGQLRQPIPLVHPRAVAAQAPLEGYLHQSNEMDTLGFDRAETACAAFN